MPKYQDWLVPERLALLAGWKREGREEADIATLMGISPETLKRWKNKAPLLREALEVDRAAVDFQVEDALLRKALGYESVEKKVEVSAKGERKEVETTKQVGPDMSAISLWLKKRKPERWGDVPTSGPKPENNLSQMLGEEGAFNSDAIPELQPPAEADPDLVETG